MVNITYKYTANAKYATDLTNSLYTLELDNLAPSVELFTVNALAAKPVTKSFEQQFEIDAPFGAAIEVKASAAYTGKVTFTGYDYLGQPVVEEVTASGTTGVMTNKCFKYISSVVCAAGAAVVVTFTRKLILGVPYKTVKIFNETRNGASVTTTQLVQPVNTEATISSSEPRGKLNLGTYASAANIKLILVADDYSDADVGGGLFGVPHFHA